MDLFRGEPPGDKDRVMMALLRSMAEKAGFKDVEVRYFQRYGIENVLGWCLEKRPRSNVHLPAIEHEVDGAWRGACSGHSMADYVVLYGRK